MTDRTIFSNISPLDHRYSLSENETFTMLSTFLSENAAVRACVFAEIALLKTHLREKNLLTSEIETNLDKIPTIITPKEIYTEEEKTKHNIRALVNVLKKQVPSEYAPLVHLGATSADILDTAFSYRIKNCLQKGILPLLKDLELLLCDLAIQEAKTCQIGRTHGQHAVPITFGFAIAEYVSRLGKSVLEINHHAKNVRGKFSGAVGAYNALSFIVKNPVAFEKCYLQYFDLEPSEYANQLVEPEYLLRLLLEINTAFGIIANLADDLRHLQRSEINEVQEFFSAEQVGSSTMPQKRNPWNCEHVKSLWKAFSPRVITFFMDQISEHQRDLTNSASQRFVADYLAGFSLAVNRMKNIIQSLHIDRNQMQANLATSGGGVLAEPAYILLSKAGFSDAHEIVRKITLDAQNTGNSFFDVLKKNSNIYEKIIMQLQDLQIADAEDFFLYPERYCGLATEKAKTLAEKYKTRMNELENL